MKTTTKFIIAGICLTLMFIFLFVNQEEQVRTPLTGMPFILDTEIDLIGDRSLFEFWIVPSTMNPMEIIPIGNISNINN